MGMSGDKTSSLIHEKAYGGVTWKKELARTSSGLRRWRMSQEVALHAKSKMGSTAANHGDG